MKRGKKFSQPYPDVSIREKLEIKQDWLTNCIYQPISEEFYGHIKRRKKPAVEILKKERKKEKKRKDCRCQLQRTETGRTEKWFKTNNRKKKATCADTEDISKALKHHESLRFNFLVIPL